MKGLRQRRGSAVDPAVEQAARRDRRLPENPPHTHLLLLEVNVGDRSMSDELLHGTFLLPASLFSKVTLN